MALKKMSLTSVFLAGAAAAAIVVAPLAAADPGCVNPDGSPCGVGTAGPNGASGSIPGGPVAARQAGRWRQRRHPERAQRFGRSGRGQRLHSLRGLRFDRPLTSETRLAPTVLADELGQRPAERPLVDLQGGPVGEVRYRAEAQDRHRLGVDGHLE